MTKFSKQHYERIADAINKSLDEAPIWEEGSSSIRAAYIEGVAMTATNIRLVFADDNPNFSRDKFILRAMKRE